MNITIDRGTLDVVQEMTITQTSGWISIRGATAGGTDTTWSSEYTAAVASGGNENYKLFTYARNVNIHFGLFRRAEIRNAADETIATVVPEISSSFVARLKITEGGNARYVAIPAGFICHVGNGAV